MRAFLVAFLFFWLGIVSAHAALVCAKGVCVKAVVVSKDDDLARGLQGRTGLNKNEGMLFVFSENGAWRFWMKDMKFSIDMIWIDHDKHIVTIAPNVPPCVTEPCKIYDSTKKAQYVLEVAAGFAQAHHFKIGDSVQLKEIH